MDYVIGNEFGELGRVSADNLQEALDEAADAGILESERMNACDHDEYEHNGWYDSYLYAGNDCAPYWSEYLWVKPLEEYLRDEERRNA